MTPQVILTILRPCTTRGTGGGCGDTGGVRDEVAEKWNNAQEDRGGRRFGERAKGNSFGLFLQIVL